MRPLKFLTGLLLLMATPASAQTSAADDEALYLQRYKAQEEAVRQGGGLANYDPLEPVVGAKPAPLKYRRAPGIAPAALAAARAYAGERNSSAFMVWRDGAIEAEAYFGSFDAKTPIVSKSLAKPVTAILVGRAIQQGHIKSLDQPVADFITEWRDDPVRSRILVRHLLDMRSGLMPQGEARGPESVLNRAYLHPRHDEVIIRDYPVIHPPGSRYEYSNASSELVAPLIERATGLRYSAYLSQALLRPIGAPGGSIWLNRPGGTAHSGCCLLLPAQSWLRIGILLAEDGVWRGKRLLPRGYVAEMRTPTPQNPHAGLGVYVAGRYVEWRGAGNPDVVQGRTRHGEPYADKDIFLFDGNGNQVVYISPATRMVILRTGERPPRDKPWDNAVLPNLLIRGIVRSDGAPAPEPQPK